jgi:hypothetical protein
VYLLFLLFLLASSSSYLLPPFTSAACSDNPPLLTLFAPPLARLRFRLGLGFGLDGGSLLPCGLEGWPARVVATVCLGGRGHGKKACGKLSWEGRVVVETRDQIQQPQGGR